MSDVKSVRLSSGYDMPLVGFGTYDIQGLNSMRKVIDELLKVGYRLIDTAAFYCNEEEIGQALKELLPKHNLKREDIFITTKLEPQDNGIPENIKKSVEKSLKSLSTTYIDLYLIHFPAAGWHNTNSPDNPKKRDITWKTLVELQKTGVLRSIGVSNFMIKHLKQVLENSYNVKPAVNQIELHPCHRQEEVRSFCEKNGIFVQAFSSLGTSGSKHLLQNPLICKIAGELGVSPARLLLKWAVQQGIGVIPKAASLPHIADNFQLDFPIDEKYMKELSAMPKHRFDLDAEAVV